MQRRDLRRATLLAAGAAIVSLAGAGTALAKDPPVPCDGKFHIVDAPGDQVHRQQGVPVLPMPASTDVLGVFYRVDDGKVTANIVVSEVVAAPPAGYSAIRYRAYVTINGTVRFVQALVTSSGVTFTTGSELQITYMDDGTTEGEIFPGKNGVIRMVLPAERGGKPGTLLEAPSATAGLLTLNTPAPTQLAPIYFQADTAPDNSEDGPETTPIACTAAPAPAPAAPVAKAKTSAPAKVTVSGKLSARKANAKRAATIKLKPSEALTGVTVTLKRGSATVGTAKLARAAGTVAVKLRLRGKLKSGAYTLHVAGKRASGAAFKASAKLRVAR